MRTPLRCRYCAKRITRAEDRLWGRCCDTCASRPEGISPAQRAYAAALLRLALAHARGRAVLVEDTAGRRYLWEAVE